MRNLRFILLTALVYGSVTASAQDINEAYNLSNTTVQGTARSMGFGNALGSVGGDFSSLSVNPAGLGVYRSSELTFTPSLRMNGASSQYNGTTTMDNNIHFNINSFGLVFTNAPKGKRYERRAWKTVSFALGMNRVADFNREYTYQGVNKTSSASQAFESDANQNPGTATSTTASSSLGYIGYSSYLLNQNANGQFTSIVPFAGGVTQMKSVQENGGIDEYTISLGGNYKEKLMLGLTIGIPNINYHRYYYYQESLADGNTASNPSGFGLFNYNESVNISGTGVNAKIGAIYKINDFIRIGAAFHSPTYYSISDFSSPGITVVHSDSSVTLTGDNGYLPQNQFDYNLTTPWKGVVSATFMLKKIGFITADYEYVEYSSMRYRYPGGFETDERAMNQEIKKTYQGVSNFRLGAEGRIGKVFMVRLGAGYYGNAYTAYGEANQLNYTTQRIDLSAGLGFHFRHFYTDLGFVHSIFQGIDQPYSVVYNNGSGTNYVFSGSQATIPQAKVDYALNNIALTLGVKF